ncbi:hypothetical protein K1T71_013728 [Dendrolimus kikuchii]|uniref:Uncharacterized protein n=1 Tax=Dendrolimus kikuchii TaxID=765133 RepID=A0ACC1CH99_9NEOP|nr:hypothetical protein K1T71_013728 [Dendrolimus kikuchii]
MRWVEICFVLIIKECMSFGISRQRRKISGLHLAMTPKDAGKIPLYKETEKSNLRAETELKRLSSSLEATSDYSHEIKLISGSVGQNNKITEDLPEWVSTTRCTAGVEHTTTEAPLNEEESTQDTDEEAKDNDKDQINNHEIKEEPEEESEKGSEEEAVGENSETVVASNEAITTEPVVTTAKPYNSPMMGDPPERFLDDP